MKSKQSIEIKAAKEIMINIKLIVISTVIGILSYFIFLEIYDINKFDNFDYSTIKISKGKRLESDVIFGLPNDSFFAGEPMPDNIEGIKSMVERRNINVKDTSVKDSFYTTICLILLIVVGRYVLQGLIWANKTSKETI